MKIATVFNPNQQGMGSTNGALNLVRYSDTFVPFSSVPIGGKPGLVEVSTLFGKPINYPVASLLDGLRELDPDGVLIFTMGGEIIAKIGEIIESWPVAWRFNVSLLDLYLNPSMRDHIPYVLSMLSKVDAIISCNAGVDADLRALGHDNVTQIPTCLDVGEFELAEPESDLVVSLSRTAPVKNLLYSILAMRVLIQHIPSARYEIYGDGDLSGPTAKFVKMMGLDRLTYEGFKHVDEVLPKAKVLLTNSLQENQSLSVLEAMTSGVPVVASDIPGHVGGSVRFDSIKETASEVEKLLTDEGYWEEKRREGLEEVQEHDVKKIVPEYEKLFESLMKLERDFKK